jgi:hypothetical protein
MATESYSTMATSISAGEIEKVKMSIATYFGSQHEKVVNTRKSAKNNYQLSVDGIQRIDAVTANGQMQGALDAEDYRRSNLKAQISLLIKLDYLLFLPNEEESYIGHGKNTIQAMVDSPPGVILQRMGTALREIEETKEYMKAFLTSHIHKETFLHSVWDMEMYKLQNAYTNLKKKVLQDWKPPSTTV